jgi:glutaminyl-peptide cyclotransferase
MNTATRRIAGSVLAALIAGGAGGGCGSDPKTASSNDATTRSTIEFVSPPTFDTTAPVVHLGVDVIATYPHDDHAYTEGLVFAGSDHLYETTGRYGHSSLREVAIATGEVTRSVSLDDAYFGEGLALSAGRLIALTWKEHTALVFDPATFEQTSTYSYDTEGWGLCDDGNRLIMSDGSATLTFRDQQSFEPVGSVLVTLDGVPESMLNELECVDGLVYANVYLTDEIVVIDPSTGAVVALVSTAGLLDPAASKDLKDGEVLNGIAYDSDRGTFYLTGKDWPSLFEVRFVPR